MEVIAARRFTGMCRSFRGARICRTEDETSLSRRRHRPTHSVRRSRPRKLSGSAANVCRSTRDPLGVAGALRDGRGAPWVPRLLGRPCIASSRSCADGRAASSHVEGNARAMAQGGPAQLYSGPGNEVGNFHRPAVCRQALDSVALALPVCSDLKASRHGAVPPASGTAARHRCLG